MILFKREHVAPILAGTKTQTRRTWARCRVKAGSVHMLKTGFGKDDSFAHVRIKDARQEPLGDITEADAKAEGYPSIAAYIEAFERIYRTTWDPALVVWVVDFALEANQ